LPVAVGRVDRLAVDEPFQEAVFQFDGGLFGSVGGEADLDLAGVGGVGVVLSAEATTC
jgi:hypothetical protein